MFVKGLNDDKEWTPIVLNAVTECETKSENIKIKLLIQLINLISVFIFSKENGYEYNFKCKQWQMY